MKTTLSRRKFLKLAGAAIVLAPVDVVYAARSQARTWTASGLSVPELAGFDTTVSNFMQARNISGGALAVTRNGRLVLARCALSFLHATAGTVQNIWHQSSINWGLVILRC